MLFFFDHRLLVIAPDTEKTVGSVMSVRLVLVSSSSLQGAYILTNTFNN